MDKQIEQGMKHFVISISFLVTQDFGRGHIIYYIEKYY